MSGEEVSKPAWKAGPDDCRWDLEPPTKPGADGNYPVPVPGFTKLA